MTDRKPRRTVAKGRRPYFFDQPEVDKLLAMTLALIGEVSVLRDRLDTHERLARKGLPGTPENIDAYAFSEDEEDERAATRRASLDRVMRIMKDDTAEDIAAAEAAYATMVGETARD